MAANLDLGPDAGVNHALAQLRDLAFSGPVAARQQILPGIYFSLDPDSGTEVMLHAKPGMMFTADVRMKHPSRFLALHIAMRDADLRAAQVMGLVAKLQAPQAATLRFAIRSTEAGGFIDTGFRKTAVGYAEPTVHVDVMTLDAEPGLIRPVVPRDLVLFFPPRAGQITLHDLRVFIV